jgi:hypothetical protein
MQLAPHIPPRLLEWVQTRPRYVNVVLMLVGALAGYIFADSTGRSAKIWTSCGGVFGFFFLGIFAYVVGAILTYGAYILLLLFLYNVFIVPDGQPWRLPQLDWSTSPKHPPRLPPDLPLANQQVYSTLRVAFAPSTNQISDPRRRMMALSQLDSFAAKGYQLVRCNYGEPSRESGSYPSYYDFWYQDSPVIHPEFPRLPPARIAVLHYFPILKCPATEREAGELWSLALAIRNEDIARNMRNAQQGMR